MNIWLGFSVGFDYQRKTIYEVIFFNKHSFNNGS